MIKKGHSIAISFMLELLLVCSGQALADEAHEHELEQQLTDVKRRLDALEGERANAPTSAAQTDSEQIGKPSKLEVSPLWDREALTTPAPLRGIYDKPFLVKAWNRVYLGGYTEFEYHSHADPSLDNSRGFRGHRTNLFAFAQVADSIHFGSEIEFENDQPGQSIEVKVETAFIDWTLYEELTIRGGIILTPLGRVNVNHDGPVRELTERPFVSTFVIPTTLSEPGVGFTGRIHFASPLKLGYEVYLTNGFALLDKNGQLAAPITQREQLLRDGRPSIAGDNNASPAFMGRVNAELFDSLTVGGSWHFGKYDARNHNYLTILAADLAFARGPFAAEGEFAWAGFQRDTFARTAGIPDSFWGYYLQVSAHHMPEALRRALPNVFGGEGAAFGVVLRFDYVDLDHARGEAIEPGINFRPFADTVFKFSYRIALKHLGNPLVSGGEGIEDGFVFSLASYF